MAPDPLEDVFDLEGRFYKEGYQDGFGDGTRAGRSEGRMLGMRTGYEKYLEAGRLANRAVVWANRLPSQTGPKSSANTENGAPVPTAEDRCTLPALTRNARLEKTIKALYALVEPATLSTENTDQAIQDFDDRIKKAQGKAKVAERMVGGGASDPSSK